MAVLLSLQAPLNVVSLLRVGGVERSDRALTALCHSSRQVGAALLRHFKAP